MSDRIEAYRQLAARNDAMEGEWEDTRWLQQTLEEFSTRLAAAEEDLRTERRLHGETMDVGNEALARANADLAAARRALEEALDAVEIAWGIIANAGGGDWKKESVEWQKAAMRWRDENLERIAEHMKARALLAPERPRGGQG